MKRRRIPKDLVLAIAVIAALIGLGSLLTGGSGEKAAPETSYPHAVVQVLSGWCKQSRDTGYIDTWVLVRNVGQESYPETLNPWDMPMYEYHYNDGGDTLDGPDPDRQQAIPVGRVMWIHFQHPYNQWQHDVDGCKVTFDYETDFSLDVRT